jgi:hypothetical protein
MTYEDFLKADQWLLFRDVVWEHYGGRCQICGGPGDDVHHLTYRHGLFKPRTVQLLCRPCHEIWCGRDPDHLSDSDPRKPKFVQIARIARSLGWDRKLDRGSR